MSNYNFLALWEEVNLLHVLQGSQEDVLDSLEEPKY